MKRLFFLLAFLIVGVGISVYAQDGETTVEKTVELNESTNLATALGDEASTVTNLIVTGSLTEEDFATMRNNLPLLQVLDMSGVTDFPKKNWSKEVNAIPDEALAGKLTLVKIVLPNTLELISISAFKGCSILETIDFSLATKLEVIGGSAFEQCIGLKELDLSNCTALNTISSNAFKNCNQLQTLDLSKCSSLSTIGNNAFTGCSSLVSLDLSNNHALEKIENEAFSYCSSLKTVDISNCSSLESIGSKVFTYCPNIESVLLTECTALKNIGDYAFAETKKLTTFDFTKLTALEHIGERAFYNEFYRDNEYRPGGLIGELKFPASLISIGQYAFANCMDITKLDFTNSVNLITIADGAFSSCQGLVSIDFTNCTSFNLSENLDFLDHGLENLHTVIIDNNYNKSDDGVIFNADKSALLNYLQGKEDENYTIPSTVTTIMSSAFPNNKHLESLTIPASVKAIHEYAFNFYGRSLNVYMESESPINLTQTIGLEDDLIYVPNKEAVEAYRKAAIWEDYKIIETGANTVVNIALETAGSLSSELEKINIPAYSVTELTLSGPVNSNDWNVIKEMKLLTKVNMGDVTLDEYAQLPAETFMNCFYLQEMILPPMVSSIGSSAFENCIHLSHLDFSKLYSLSSIGDFAFRGCPLIGSLYFYGGTLSYIGDEAFSSTTVSSITLRPLSVVYVSKEPFSDIIKEICIIKVPKGMKEKYKESSYWSSFKNIQEFGQLITIKYKNNPSSFYCNYTGEGAYEAGEIATLTASCQEQTWNSNNSYKDIYLFDGWYDEDNKISSEPIYTYTVEEGVDKTFKANFVEVSFSSDIEDGNSFLKLKECNIKSAKVAVEIPENSKYGFMGWYENGTCISTETELTVAAGTTTHRYIEAQFIESGSTIYGEVTFTDANKVDGIDIDFAHGPMTVEGEKTWNLNSFTYNDGFGSYTALLVNSPMQVGDISFKANSIGTYWAFISFPYDLKMSEIDSEYDTQFVVRRYDGQERAANGTGSSWKQLAATDVLKANQGYIMQAQNYRNFSFNAATGMEALFNKAAVTIPLQTYASESALDANWNFVGNPYPAFYSVKQLFDDGFDSPIAVWSSNLGNYEYYTADDDDVYLTPMTAFFVQKNAKDLVFKPEGRVVKVPETSNTTRSNLRSDDGRTVINLVLANDSLSDRTRIVFNEAASTDYELGKDAVKFQSMNVNAPSLFTLDQSNNMLAINERPMENGVIRLGITIGVAGTYTFRLREAVEMGLTLIDLETGATCDLSTGEYTFNAEAGSCNDRFELRSGTPTGIETIAPQMKWAVTDGQLIVNGCPNGATITLVDALGRIAYTAKAMDDQQTIALPQSGVYYLVVVTTDGQRAVHPVIR